MVIFGFGEEKKKRTSIGKTAWEVLKKKGCFICGKSERQVGLLEKAHIKAHSKGGSAVVPMCPTCHTKYDRGSLTATQLKKLGIPKEDYACLRPKKPKKKDSGFFF